MEKQISTQEVSELATWEQPRSTEQLLGFIARREAEIFSANE